VIEASPLLHGSYMLQQLCAAPALFAQHQTCNLRVAAARRSPQAPGRPGEASYHHALQLRHAHGEPPASGQEVVL
jgi:hypothetical protein